MVWKTIYEGNSLEEAAEATAAYAEKYIADKYVPTQQNQGITGASLQQGSSGRVEQVTKKLHTVIPEFAWMKKDLLAVQGVTDNSVSKVIIDYELKPINSTKIVDMISMVYENGLWSIIRR